MYEPKDYSHLIGTEGFSDDILKNHFKLYEGYVINTNKLADRFAQNPASTPEDAELRRRFGWEFNGMRLHEQYFGNMTKDSVSFSEGGKLAEGLKKDFGSVAKWEDDFRSVGGMRGIGWTILSYDKEGDRLFNLWINEHDIGHLSGATPLLVIDVFEHAFVLDYGVNRGAYIDAFMNAVDWDIVEERFKG